MIKITAEATTSITGLIYTNFDVKPEYEKVLEPIEGVEWVRIRSRYSLFVGIGRCKKASSYLHILFDSKIQRV